MGVFSTAKPVRLQFVGSRGAEDRPSETIHHEISRNLEYVRLGLEFSDRSEIWQATRQLYYYACQISERYSLHQTSRSLEHARFGVEMNRISRPRDFTRSNGKTSYCLLNRRPGLFRHHNIIHIRIGSVKRHAWLNRSSNLSTYVFTYFVYVGWGFCGE